MDDFKNIRVLGRGSFGMVYLYERLSDNRHVVIKQISVDKITQDEQKSTSEEVKVLSILNHPNVIEYYTSFIEHNILSIVMEYAAGGTLCSFLRNCEGKHLRQEKILNLFCQMLLGLQHIHCNKIIHRDLTTDNIFLTVGPTIVKIGDFGISKVLASKSRTNSVVGTPCYMSPELCEGKPYNYKTDVWALGCILYEMLTLKKAFETLPSLVIKIMKGLYEPLNSSLYDIQLQKLVPLMLHHEQNQRPSVEMITAHPAIMVDFYSLYADLGNI